MVQGVPQRATFGSQMFTFRGRSNRANYWLSLLVVVIAYSIVLTATMVAFSQSDDPMDIHPIGLGILFLNWGMLILFGLFAAMRRLHDRDKSGHWLWLFAFVPAVLNVADFLGQLLMIVAIPRAVLLVPALALSIWGIIEFGFLPGTTGSNQYGPDPLTQEKDDLPR
jgi:uncharacterized membrane protein YhaH (DUF805 family)